MMTIDIITHYSQQPPSLAIIQASLNLITWLIGLIYYVYMSNNAAVALFISNHIATVANRFNQPGTDRERQREG
jgi:hypothetical protein